MSGDPTRALSRSEQRKRALIDAGAGLALTMLLWPFPLARATLSPLVNVVSVLIAWGVVNVVYHLVCARVWRRTAGTHLLGLSLCGKAAAANDPCVALDDRTALKWGVAAGALVVVNVVWADVARFIADASGAQLRS